MKTLQEIKNEIEKEFEAIEAKMVDNDEKELREDLKRLETLVNTLSREESEIHVKAFQEKIRAKMNEAIDRKIAIAEAKKKYLLNMLNKLND